MTELSQKLKSEFFLTTLAIFDDPVDNSRIFHRERENWEKIIQHRQDFMNLEVLNINVLVDFPQDFSSNASDHLQGLVKYWNDLTCLLEKALDIKIYLFHFELENEMRNPVMIFQSKREEIESSTSEPADASDLEAYRDDEGSDDDDKELDDSNFDVYWNI